ncbi:MAG: hypothetical protein K0Q94_569 [Paenibacillus sp.]|jgi:hypothetical protein|nr:hypothetical protein [Paenibacillus sp.]
MLSNWCVNGEKGVKDLDKEAEKMLYDVSYFQELMQSAFSDAYEAYEAYMNYEGDIRYSIALNYLILSHQSYVELKRLKHESGLDHYEVEGFFTAYEEYKFQFKKFIADKDTNTSWLFGTHERLMDNWKSTNEFLLNYLKANRKR